MDHFSLITMRPPLEMSRKENKDKNYIVQGRLTITPDDFWTEWCYSGHSGRFYQILGRVDL